MRQTIAGFVAGAAFAVAVGVTPASACVITNPCSSNYQYGGHYGYNVQQFSAPQISVQHVEETTADRLADPMGPQYYYVNQGPLYTGPGRYAPAPTYQERAPIGWHGYRHAYRHHVYRPHRVSHYYHAPRMHRTAMYYHRPVHFRPYRVAPHRYYAARPAMRYAHPGMMPHRGYAPRFYGHPRAHGPRMRMVPHYAGPHRSQFIDK